MSLVLHLSRSPSPILTREAEMECRNGDVTKTAVGFTRLEIPGGYLTFGDREHLEEDKTAPATSGMIRVKWTRDIGSHFYVKDYRGSIMAVCSGETGAVEQTMDYLPSGTLFNATNYGMQPRRFCGKEEMTQHSWNMYDSKARFQYARLPRFSTMDPLLEKYYHLSPYNYAENDFVNKIDPSGKGWIKAEYGITTFYYFDQNINSAKDLAKYYSNTDGTISYVGSTGFFELDGVRYHLLADGTIRFKTFRVNKEHFFEGGGGEGVMTGSDRYTKERKKRNWHGNYLGPDNPELEDGGDSYALPPIDWLDYAAWRHDRGYDKTGLAGRDGVLSLSTIGYDMNLAVSALRESFRPSSLEKAKWSVATAALFSATSVWKYTLNQTIARWYLLNSK